MQQFIMYQKCEFVDMDMIVKQQVGCDSIVTFNACPAVKLRIMI